ncbi:MAG: hypothetical protein H6Q89_696 [Myxococcaceae bacterium]|nr:hypothetical protein [Myxococcaceae bacterium]
MRRALLLLGLGAASVAFARTPPIAPDPREGGWLGAGELYLHLTTDKWAVFNAGATVNKLAVDGQVVWLATDDGALRLDAESRGAQRLGMDDGLPSQAVTAVGVDEQFVWFATNKGLARFRKLDRTWRVFTDVDGLPHRAVNDVLRVGRQLWIATRGGLAMYDPDVDGLRGWSVAEGLVGENLAELFQVGEDVWCRTDAGLSRFRPRTRTFTNFSWADLGATELRAFVVDGERVWLGTDQGLLSLELTSDTLVPFSQQSLLESASIRGVELLSDYLFITTDAEVVQVHKTNRSMRRFTEADGLTRRQGAVGTLLSGGLFVMLFPDGAQVYDVQRELWAARPLLATQEESATRGRAFARLNAEVPIDARSWTLSEQRFATAEGGFGFSHRFANKRTLDASARLDYGQLELPGIRDVTARLEYQGNPTDVLREVRAEDKYLWRTREEGLERPLSLRGGGVRVASEGEEPTLQGQVSGGLRRGVSQRDFFTGAPRPVISLSHRYVLPGSERVWVDGELLTNGADYTVIYPAGQLAFLDLERVDPLSVIEVEYEADLVPRKGLGVLSLLDLLPADREVGDWTRAGDVRLVSEESGLYAQIDGAAPRYLDRGWVKSVFGEYRQGGRTIQVSIHDLGTEANARALYDFDLPPAREAVDGQPTLVIDLGLATAFAARAVLGSYYLELAIDEKSDAARQSLKLFAIQVLDRGTGAGANRPGESSEWLASARIAASPLRGTEFGARVVGVTGTAPGPAGEPPRQLLTAVGDGRYEHSVGEAGLFTAYGELAGNHRLDGLADGFGAMARLRLSHPWLEGTLLGRHDSPGFQAVGTANTRFGRLADEGRAQVTGYPLRWLPISGFFSRQSSITADGLGGTEQHALARVQLARERLPTVSLQLGHTLLEGGGGTTVRLKGMGQAEYDFAQGLLAFTGMKRFWVRALYSASGASTEEGVGPRADTVQLVRLEARIAPTATTSGWILFRHRKVHSQQAPDEPLLRANLQWELLSGARTAIIPGLVPQVSYSASFEDDRITQPAALRSAKGVVAGTLTLQPGAWFAALTPLVIEPRVSLAGDSRAEGELRTSQSRTLRFDNRAVWSGTYKINVELFELWEQTSGGPLDTASERRLELRNRVILRPNAVSSYTVRFDFARTETANDLALQPDAPVWGEQRGYEGAVEWLRRWSSVFTTRLRGVYGLADTRGLLLPNPLVQGAVLQSFLQHRVGGELELRFFALSDRARLFVVQRDRVFRLFGTGAGASEAVDYDASLGVVWALGEKLYVDAEVTWKQTVCLAPGCTAARTLQPRLMLTCDL